MSLLTSVNPALVGIPVASAVSAMGAVAWGKEMRRRAVRAAEKARHAQAQARTVTLRAEGDHWQRVPGEGQISLLLDGTFAMHVGIELLWGLARADAGDYLGAIYALELDRAELGDFLKAIPAEFKARVVTASCELHGGGLGDSIADMLRKSHLWKQDVMLGAEQWLSRIQGAAHPVFCLALISPGGMAAPGRCVLDAYKERYPDQPIYAVTILDDKPEVRPKFGELRQLFTHGDLPRGMWLMDNRRASRRNDRAFSLLLPGMISAAWTDPHPLAIWNALVYLFAKEAQRTFATISPWQELIPVRLAPAFEKRPARFVAEESVIVEKIMRGVRALVTEPSRQSVALPTIGKGHTRLIYVIAPIVPDPDLRRIGRRVDENLAEWLAATDPDIQLHYASIATPMGPETREVPLTIVFAQLLDADGATIDAYGQGERPIDARFLPPLSASEQFLRNGHSKQKTAQRVPVRTHGGEG